MKYFSITNRCHNSSDIGNALDFSTLARIRDAAQRCAEQSGRTALDYASEECFAQTSDPLAYKAAIDSAAQSPFYWRRELPASEFWV